MRYFEIICENETDSRYVNDGLTRDPDHRLKQSGHWGSSHYNSSQITGHSAKRMKTDGFKISSTEAIYDRLALKKLKSIFQSTGSKEPLYHGFEDRKHREWRVGEVLTLPLTATSGSLQRSATYGVGLNRENKTGPSTVFEFPKGTRIVGYTKFKPADAKEFGHHWMEAIVAGKFRIIDVRSVQYERTWRDDIFLTVVRLEPVSYFDPETDTWVDA